MLTKNTKNYLPCVCFVGDCGVASMAASALLLLVWLDDDTFTYDVSMIEGKPREAMTISLLAAREENVWKKWGDLPCQSLPLHMYIWYRLQDFSRILRLMWLEQCSACVFGFRLFLPFRLFLMQTFLHHTKSTRKSHPVTLAWLCCSGVWWRR